MRNEVIQNRQSKFQKHAGYDEYKQEQEKFMVALRKNKRQDHFMKHRLNNALSISKQVPPILIESFPLIASPDTEGKIQTILNILKSNTCITEVLKYCLSLYESEEGSLKSPRLFSEFVQKTKETGQVKQLAYELLLNYTFWNEAEPVPRFFEDIFGNCDGIPAGIVVNICYNMIIDCEVGTRDINFIISMVFNADINKEIWKSALDLTKVILSKARSDLDLAPILAWVSKTCLTESDTQSSAIDIVLKITLISEGSNLVNQISSLDLTAKVLIAINENPEYSCKGLRIIKNIARFVKVELLSPQSKELLKAYLFKNQFENSILALQILKTVLGAEQTSQYLSLSFVSNVVSHFAAEDSRQSYKALVFANYLLENYKETAKYFVEGRAFEQLFKVVQEEKEKKFLKQVLCFCLNLISFDEEHANELQQLGMFEALDNMTIFYDVEAFNLYADFFNYRPVEETETEIEIEIPA